MANDMFKNLVQSGQRFINATTNEARRVVNEAGRHVTESIDAISKGIKDGGFVGGAAVAADKLSPGNFAAGMVDSILPGDDLPKPLAEGISAGVNFSIGALIPGAALPLQVMALVDGYQTLSALGPGVGAAEAKASGGQRMQTPESPQNAIVRAKEAKAEKIAEARKKQLEEAKERAKAEVYEKAQDNKLKKLEERLKYLEGIAHLDKTKPHGGFSDGGVDTVGFISNDFLRIEVDNVGTGSRDGKLAKMERDLAKVNAEIDRILNNPNLSFEDMIFLLMRALIKQSQLEVQIGLREEKISGDKAAKAEKAERALLQKEEADLAKMRGEIARTTDPKKRGDLEAAFADKQTALNARRENFSASVSERTESRQERLEELKQALQKITEMQQALSNILNTLHQTALNTIGNIR